MKLPHVEPTPQQLQAAFQRLRRRSWPDTLDAALADPVYGPLTRCLAVSLARMALQPAPATPARPPAAPQRPAFDARRAAANDRDDLED